MPVVSMFFGIIITFNFRDHNPPHFHARYGEHKATFSLDGELQEGMLPSKQLKLVQAWAALREDELRANWEIASNGGEPFRIEPIR